MNISRIEQIGQFEGQAVEIRGWLYNRRSSGKIQFLLVRDGSGIIQAVVSRHDVPPEVFADAERLTQESSLRLWGLVRADRRAPGGYELIVHGLRVVHITADYPITPKEHGIAFLMEQRHLWLRSSRQHATLRIRAEVMRACRDYLDDCGFIAVDAPILTPAACEGTTTLFQLDYFGEKAYLTQSGQLYNEATIGAFGKVYCFGPTFRAERSKTRRHLMEFWMLEPEMAFADLDEVIRTAEGLVCAVVERVLAKRRGELETLQRDLAKLEAIRRPFPRVTYDEALEILTAREAGVPWGEDFGAPQETALGEHFDRPVFITHYPAQCKAFYMKRDLERPEVVLGADLIAPEGYGELVGGGVRMDDHDELAAAIEAHGLPREAFAWYLDLRRYGSCPHGGFGLGIERAVAWICGLEHVRETIPFPRMLYRIYP